MSDRTTGLERPEFLPFFPDRNVTPAQLRRILREGTRQDRAWVVSQLLRYAGWDEIWNYVSREEVRALFPDLDLPENLRQAWARMLKIEATTVP